jgi:hypothetical protein
MNIKSLLIGSAAASVVAVSGAQAADPIIFAEPEPMEYVRICDVYGAGYFYIPGTETCLRVGGWVRYEVGTNDAIDGWNKLARARLEFNARNESELGTVASYVRLDSRLVNGVGRDGTRDNRWDAQYSLGVGGLEMGFRDSQWNRFSGYGGLTDGGRSYGYQERHYISYTLTSGAFSGIISLDHDNNANYMPDVMAGIAGSFGDVRATLSGGYDESVESFALKGTINAPVGPATLRLVGFYADAPNAYFSDSRWSVIGGIGAPVTETTAVALDVQYWSDEGNVSGAEWGITGNISQQIAPGLSALLEVDHVRFRSGADSTGGFLRFQRSF